MSTGTVVHAACAPDAPGRTCGPRVGDLVAGVPYLIVRAGVACSVCGKPFTFGQATACVPSKTRCEVAQVFYGETRL